MIELRILEDLEEVSRAAVALCEQAFAAAKGTFDIALSGGKTPGRAYELLAQSKLDWQRTHIYWVDERCVPPDSPNSNQGLASRALFDRVPLPAANVHPMNGGADPEMVAMAYAEQLEGVRLDFCFMGLGSDGHTASLFSGDDASLRTEKLVVHTHSPAGVPDRLSLTPAALSMAGLLVFLVCGEDKRIPLQRFNAGEPLPSRYVADLANKVVVLADRSAAG